VIGEGRFRICEVKEGVYEVLFAENLVDDLCESLLVQLQEFFISFDAARERKLHLRNTTRVVIAFPRRLHRVART
jgi:hypothetical protein